jgi:hypothetical protein
VVPALCSPARLRALLIRRLPSSLPRRSSVQAAARPLARRRAVRYDVAVGLAEAVGEADELALALTLCLWFFALGDADAVGVGGGE